MLVVMVAVQAAAGSIFLFEWISPSGYNMSQSHNQEQSQGWNFSEPSQVMNKMKRVKKQLK